MIYAGAPREFYIGNLGIGTVGSGLLYLMVKGGASYHWKKHSTLEFTVSYTHSTREDETSWLAACFMLRAIFW